MLFEGIGTDQEIGQGDVDLWSVSLKASGETLKRLSSVLSPDETVRAERFRFERHRRRFIVARSFLRSVLASYLSIEASSIDFQYGPHGKPAVHSDLRFNLSDSAELAVVAVTRGREIGIDIERLRPKPADRLAERFFAPWEAEQLHAMAPEKKERAFFSCWTRKEAYLKARGSGLACPLHRFRVVVDPDAAPRLLSVDEDPLELERWTMMSIEPEQGYLGAVVVAGDLASLRERGRVVLSSRDSA